jgi:hypothetical protein
MKMLYFEKIKKVLNQIKEESLKLALSEYVLSYNDFFKLLGKRLGAL